MKKLAITAGLALVVGIGATACSDTTPSSNDTARVQVLLTDAPGDLSSAEVTISEIYLQGQGRVPLYTAGGTFDLLDLQNGVTAELANVVVPAGSYNDLRLVVSAATITTLDGRTYSTSDGTLQCPSCQQSGLKVKLPGGSVNLETESEVLLIDFDVEQSFGRQAGQSGRWVMHPVVHAFDFQTTGSIAGSVALAEGVTLPETCGGDQVTLAHFVPRATFGEIVLSGVADAQGGFRFAFAAPGTYGLSFADRVEFDNGDVLTFEAGVEPTSVTVGSGSSVSASYLITSAVCTPAA